MKSHETMQMIYKSQQQHNPWSRHANSSDVIGFRVLRVCRVPSCQLSMSANFCPPPSAGLSRPPASTVMAPKKRSLPAGFHNDSSSQSSQANASSSRSYAHPSASLTRASKQPRTARNSHPSRAVSGSSQHDPVVIGDDDDDNDEDDASQDAPDATQGYNEQQYDYSLYGVQHTKIVGVRFYSGYATVGEMVICRREPLNQYDCE